jgi:hypothetical protein
MSIQKIHDRLKDLYLNRRKELDELIDPDPIWCKDPHNLALQFPGILEWLRTMDRAAVAHISAELLAHRDHALKREIDKYKRRKKHYEEQINDNLAKIGGFDVGRAVFAEIRRSRKQGTFRPFIPKDKVNADVRADDWVAANERGMPVYWDKGVIDGSGTGKGSDVTIDYSPDLFGVFNNAPRHVKTLSGPASRSDEVLLHELVHASRQMNGCFYDMPVSGDYDDEEEYLAVVIANIYLSNKTQTVFRKNHHGHHILPNPDDFLDSTACNLTPRVLLERLRLNQGTLYQALAAIPEASTPFNPVRWYEDERTGKKKAA